MPIEEPLPSETLSVLIGRDVIRALGKPEKLLKVKVIPVGGSNFRVNVLVGNDANSASITDSFFVAADAKGNITDSSPSIVRRY